VATDDIGGHPTPFGRSRCLSDLLDSLDCLPVGQAFLPVASRSVKGLLSFSSLELLVSRLKIERASQLVKELQLFDPELAGSKNPVGF
jgi:hypothetical protein